MSLPNSDRITKTVQEVIGLNPSEIVVVALQENGSVAIRASKDNVAVLHWLFNKALFELNIMERMLAEAEGPDLPEEPK